MAARFPQIRLKIGENRAAVSVAVFSRFAIYANVVSATTYNARMTEDITVLFRPVGPRELALLEASSWKRWPARLPEQPIFYPVANFEYASEIALEVERPAFRLRLRYAF